MTVVTSTSTTIETGVASLVEAMKEDYAAWTSRLKFGKSNEELAEVNRERSEKFNNGLEVKFGRKYVKVVSNGSVCAFVVNTESDKKFNFGDVLKPASWSAPARNFPRGNVLEGGYNIAWTGA